MNEKIKEKFLLDLLYKSDTVYHIKSNGENCFYFYIPNLGEHGCKIVIPCQNSTNFDLVFVFDRTDHKKSGVLNYSAGSIYDFPLFFAELYQKYEAHLNKNSFYEENKDRIKDIIKTPFENLNKNNFSNEPNNYKKTYQFSTEEGKTIIHLGKALFSYDSEINFAPLEPIKLEYYWENKTRENYSYLTKIIPAYHIEEFPLLSHFSRPAKCFSDFKEFTEELSKVSDSPKSKGVISSLVLDLELNKNETKSKKHKI
jgi:hypothetical protein